MKKVLVIAPHMDDEILGCGGTIARHVKEGDQLFVSFLAHRIYNRQFNKEKNETEKKHASKAREVLGYKELAFFELKDERFDISVQDIIILLEKYVNKVKPNIVYIPFMNDNNQDHRAVFNAARVVFKASSCLFY